MQNLQKKVENAKERLNLLEFDRENFKIKSFDMNINNKKSLSTSPSPIIPNQNKKTNDFSLNTTNCFLNEKTLPSNINYFYKTFPEKKITISDLFEENLFEILEKINKIKESMHYYSKEIRPITLNKFEKMSYYYFDFISETNIDILKHLIIILYEKLDSILKEKLFHENLENSDKNLKKNFQNEIEILEKNNDLLKKNNDSLTEKLKKSENCKFLEFDEHFRKFKEEIE